MNNSNEIACNFELEFLKFREDILNSNTNNLTKAFNFPYTNENIWHIIYFDEVNAEYDSKKPFDKGDLIIHFESLFNKDYRKTLRLIDIEKFMSDKKYTTDFIKTELGGSSDRCKLKATLDTEKKEITLMLYYEFFEDGEKYESAIHNIIGFSDCSYNLTGFLFVG